MQTNLRQIYGNWDLGYVLDKHTVSSTPKGLDHNGRTIWDTVRTEVGEALFQLKYRSDWNQVGPIAAQIAASYPSLNDVGFIVPMPASKVRARQPVYEIATELGRLIGKPAILDLLAKAPTGKALKDLGTKAERQSALKDAITLQPKITNEGQWTALVVDDLFDTGASMEAACTVLRTYPKVGRIYVAAVTW